MLFLMSFLSRNFGYTRELFFKNRSTIFKK
nr:MAG TPA: hypothetical protein [Inoviridae sp.]